MQMVDSYILHLLRVTKSECTEIKHRYISNILLKVVIEI